MLRSAIGGVHPRRCQPLWCPFLRFSSPFLFFFCYSWPKKDSFFFACFFFLHFRGLQHLPAVSELGNWNGNGSLLNRGRFCVCVCVCVCFRWKCARGGSGSVESFWNAIGRRVAPSPAHQRRRGAVGFALRGNQQTNKQTNKTKTHADDFRVETNKLTNKQTKNKKENETDRPDTRVEAPCISLCRFVRCGMYTRNVCDGNDTMTRVFARRFFSTHSAASA